MYRTHQRNDDLLSAGVTQAIMMALEVPPRQSERSMVSLLALKLTTGRAGSLFRVTPPDVAGPGRSREVRRERLRGYENTYSSCSRPCSTIRESGNNKPEVREGDNR